MNQTEIFQRIKTVTLAELMHLPKNFKITEETTWKELELDSMDTLNIVMALEHGFNIQIPDIDSDKFFDGTMMDSVKIMRELLTPFE